MALGGGTFFAQSEALPGAYINFVSLASASEILSDRGIVTMPLELDWGVEGQVFAVTNEKFYSNSLEIFGYNANHNKMKGLRDVFKNATTLYAYRLNGGEKATNTYATAKFGGVRGNDLKIIIKVNADDVSAFDVQTVLDGVIMDEQTVLSASSLVDNAWVTFKTNASLVATAGTSLAGGTNKTVTGTEHSDYLDKIESYSFNTMGVVTTDDTTKALYTAFERRMREEVGAKFQVVLYRHAADYEGVINVKNQTTDADWSEASIVYWTTGAEAGCEVNKSILNKIYDGEFTVDVDYTQAELTQAIKSGELVFHQVGFDVRVLEDINSLVSTTETKGAIFRENQTIRVIDQIANDTAVLFNTQYLGTVPNDEAGRISLWTDLVKYHQQLQDIRAIESFTDADIVISRGNDKKSVVVSDAITVVGAMAKLYMTVTVG